MCTLDRMLSDVASLITSESRAQAGMASGLFKPDEDEEEQEEQEKQEKQERE